MVKYLFGFILFMSCTSSPPETGAILLSTDEHVVQLFDEDEIAGLNLIVSFFDSIMVNLTAEHNVGNAYRNYFKSLDHEDSPDMVLLDRMGLSNPATTAPLLEAIKTNKVFDEIWVYRPVKYNPDYSLHSSASDTTLMRLNYLGKYLQLLGLVGSKNTSIQDYHMQIINSGGISPSAISGMMLHYYKDVDFNQDIFRLIWAIHYITIFKQPE